MAVLDDYQHQAHGLADWDALDAEVTFLHEPVPVADLPAALAGSRTALGGVSSTVEVAWALIFAVLNVGHGRTASCGLAAGRANDPILRAPHTVLTPHLGYVSEAALAGMYAPAVEDIAGYQAGAPIRPIS